MRAIWSVLERMLGLGLLAVAGVASVFVVMHAVPGDPALSALGDQATPEAVAAFRQHWHLDDPIMQQFWRWLSGAIRGDFGVSLTIASGTPIRDLLAVRLPQTAFVGAYALLIAVFISLVAGTISALQHGRIGDAVTSSLAAIGVSMPDFWIAYILIYALALGTGLFPAYGYISPAVSIAGALHSAFLPALAIAAPMAAVFTRILRASLLENLHKDHVLVAKSLGHPKRFVFVHHVLRNALIPYITVIGLQIRYLLGGTVVIERIFGIPGLGNLTVDAAFGRDFPVVQACTVVFLCCVLLTNFSVDLVCAALNPRARRS